MKRSDIDELPETRSEFDSESCSVFFESFLNIFNEVASFIFLRNYG